MSTNKPEYLPDAKSDEIEDEVVAINECVLLYGFFLKKSELLKALLVSLRKDTLHIIISKMRPPLPLEIAIAIVDEAVRELPLKWPHLVDLRLFNILPGQKDLMKEEVERFYTSNGSITFPDNPANPMTKAIEIARTRMEAKLSLLAVCARIMISA
jgi:hypothetical protein